MKTAPTFLRGAALAALTSASWFSIASLAGAPASPQPDPWIGMWDLNLAKSRIRPDAVPKSDTRTFVPTSDGERAAWHDVDQKGRELHTVATYKFDGRDYPITGGDTLETLSFTRVDSHTLAFVGKENGKVVRTGTRAVSKDGKLLTVTVKGTDASGKPTQDLWVLDRRVATSAADVLKNARQFHDPRDKWKAFSGQVRLVTNYGGAANSGEEILEFRNADGYYRRMATRGGESSVYGIERGAAYRSSGGGTSASDSSAGKQKGPTDEAIRRMYQHHAAHLGYVMAIAGSGLQLAPSAEATEFHGRPVHALTFTRTPKVVHPYWDADTVVYLDRDTFALCGYKTTSGERAGTSVAVLGDLDIDGIRIPRTKIYYGANGVYQFTDVFTRP